MTRPSGVCGEDPCYTTGDIEEIETELAVAQAAHSEAEAVTETAQQLVTTLEEELSTANGNACIC